MVRRADERRVRGPGKARKREAMRGRRMVRIDQRTKEEVKVGWMRIERSGILKEKAGVGERMSHF